MNDKRWRAIGEWLMELSALMAVFPPLELVIKEGHFDLAMLLPVSCALFLAGGGLYLLGRS